MIVRCIRQNYFRMEPAGGLVSECQTFLDGRFNVIQCGMYRGLSIIKIHPRGGCNYAFVVASNPRAEEPRSRAIFQTGKIERESPRKCDQASHDEMHFRNRGRCLVCSFLSACLLGITQQNLLLVDMTSDLLQSKLARKNKKLRSIAFLVE